MARSGPPPKPRAAKVAEGTYRKDRDNGAPEPTAALPEPPEHLGPDAMTEWYWLAPKLHAQGLMADDYRDGLACYCDAFEDWAWACRAIAEEGRTFKTPNGYVQQHPAVGIKSAARDQMRKFMAEYGLTPASRTRVTAIKGANKPANRFAVLRGAKGAVG